MVAWLGVLLLCLSSCIIERIDALIEEKGVTYVPTNTSEASEMSETSAGGTSTSTTTSISTSTTAGSGIGSSGAVASTTTGAAGTSDGDAGETTASPAPVCGDGVVEGDETCDDGNQISGDGCQQCAKDSVIFVTSAVFQGGKLEGLYGADQNCRSLAAKANLARFETFRAWLSDSEMSAADRLVHSKGRYVLVNGLVVANDWDELTSGTLQRPIVVDEHSQTQDVGVWTGTMPDGQTALGSELCSDWIDMSQKQTAGWGVSSELGMYWSFVDHLDCGGELALYCLEQ